MRLSVRGSYFINFCGDSLTVKASQGRLISCTAAAKWMGDNKVVFHSGFYSKNHVEKINDVVQKAMNEIVEFIKSFE